MKTAVAVCYATLNVPPSVAAELQVAGGIVLREKGLLSASLRRRLEVEREGLVDQEDHVLDLVGNPDWLQDRLEIKMPPPR